MSDITIFKDRISSEEEVRDILGFPGKLVQNKTISVLDHHCKNFIALSSFLLIATADSRGKCDVSPRGDSSGFVTTLNDKCLVIPERPGNKKIDSIRNILSNPHVGLIFIIPGLEETLRINGKACITRDQELLRTMEVNGKVPLLAIGVEVEECFIHCAKAFKRSGIWNEKNWIPKESQPSIPQIIKDHCNLPGVQKEDIKKALDESYSQRLY